jgi:2-polyprenyl-3-methyl-5-hydroxy-6-metoxy-1,4-benzoquinol methylase
MANYTLKADPDFGFLRVHPTPSQEEITRFYAEEFYSQKYGAFNNSALEVQEADKEFHDAHRQDICDTILDVSGRSLEGQSVLDVGCGWGQALLHFANQGMKCCGFDPAPEAVEYVRSKGVECVVAGMDSMDVFGGRKFDVVTLLNVLEHLADPARVMAEIRATVLKPGGVLVVEVPNDFNDLQVAGRRLHELPEWWVAPPAHLNYFSGPTLAHLLRGTGYDVARLEATFPVEMFLLFGEKYVGDSDLGRACHRKRVAFEMNLRKLGYTSTLRSLYAALAEKGLGRQVLAVAVAVD